MMIRITNRKQSIEYVAFQHVFMQQVMLMYVFMVQMLLAF